jgi:hypothetical protein
LARRFERIFAPVSIGLCPTLVVRIVSSLVCCDAGDGLSGKAPTGHAGISVERIGQLFVATGRLYILIADFFDGRLQFEIQMRRY